ncbi:MAG: ComEC/Rec2 family competence protein, partial [Flavobacteriales bacterium]
MFRLLIPFVAGIITGVFTHKHFQFQEYIAIAALLLLLIAFFTKKIYTKYRFRIFFGLLVDICLFILAYTLTISKTESLNASHFSRAYKKGTLVLVQLDERPVEREKTYKLIVDVLKVKCDDAWKEVSGHALLYLQKDSSTSGLSYGDILLIRPDFKEIPPPQNPGEFNYKRYLGFHQIGWQSYLPASKCIVTGKNRGSAVYYHAQHLRQACLEVFSDHGLQGDEYAVASALILGYKDALDDQIRHSFASAGAMHVLAVSGLHVGIIFLVLKSLLGFLERLKYGVFIKTFIMLSGLWFYAALTGFSPSVMRATTMFSFILIGKAMNRTAVIYNTLAASAFALLLFNPFLIMEVGFQLSYLAVVGIVFIQPRLYHIWHPKLWIIDKIWAITTVSLAAQIATFPLGLLYFHQFPNYFLFSNLIVIPMAAVILYNGMLVLALSFSDILCHWASVVLSAFVHFLNTA